MDGEQLKNLFEEKYSTRLGKSFEEWIVTAPNSEQQAYDKLEQLNNELSKTEEAYQEATGDQKWELGEYREKIRNEYQFIEELFGLESEDE